MSSLCIDLTDRRPIYEQLIDQIKGMILRGIMQPGEQLPSVRTLAGELAINPNTIQKAYTELERLGFTYSVAGRGSFISSDPTPFLQEHQDRIQSDVAQLLTEARNAGMEQETFNRLIGEIWGGGKR